MDTRELIISIRWKWKIQLGKSKFFLSLVSSAFDLGMECLFRSWKRSGEQYDDRVVEVVWDKERDTWELLRFRDDKREGNYKTVVTSIIKSIQHGVEAETVSHSLVLS